VSKKLWSAKERSLSASCTLASTRAELALERQGETRTELDVDARQGFGADHFCISSQWHCTAIPFTFPRVPFFRAPQDGARFRGDADLAVPMGYHGEAA